MIVGRPHAVNGNAHRILTVLHQPGSTAGRVGELLEERGYTLERCRPCCGDELPRDLSPYGGVVVFGGPMSANDCQVHDGIRLEIEHAKRVLDADVPYLGLCLGAQILSRALGGAVTPHPQDHVEVGYTEIIPEPGAGDVFEHSTHFFQFHREGFEVPPGGELLATGTNSFPNQAFRAGERAYGFQFHPEITLEMIHRWNMGGAHRLTRPGAQHKRAHIKGFELFNDSIERWTRALFDRMGMHGVMRRAEAAE